MLKATVDFAPSCAMIFRMKKPGKLQPAPDSLFGDLSITETRELRETIDIPLDDSLDLILTDLRASPVCGACRGGMPLVFGMGAPRAELMLIGEGPGLDDVQSGQPFQGQAGVLLVKMMAAINVALQECYVTNVIKCIPPGERKFSVEEIEDCRPFLLRQILTVGPRIILAFGALAAQTLLRTERKITELRGEIYTLHLNDRPIAIVPTFNPAYLLRIAEKKREAWEDLKLVRDFLTS
jgi:uracil-DNA glycosylase family 4